MCHVSGMAREDLHFRLRIPDSLKKRLQLAGALKGRSITAEIVFRLESSFAEEDLAAIGKDPEDAELLSIIADLDDLKLKIVSSHRRRKETSEAE